MKTRTFTTRFYRCNRQVDGSLISNLLQSEDTTVSDMSITIQQVNSFMRTYVRTNFSRGCYLVQTSCNHGRVLCSVYVEF